MWSLGVFTPRFLICEILRFGPSVYVKEKVQKKLSELVLVNASLGNNDVCACALSQLSTSLVFVLNGTPQRPVGPTGRGVHRSGRSTIQVSHHTGEGPVHPTCMLINRPAGVYFGRPVHHTNS